MEAPPTPFDIFLSHSGEQKGFVTDLEDELSSIGYSVFFDKNEESLPPGQPFPPLILSAAKSCKLAIVVLSHEFLTSYWPMLELCEFAKRLPRAGEEQSHHSNSFTLLPLFYKLSPEEIKTKNKLKEWIVKWIKFEQLHGPDRLTAAKCEEAVINYLVPRNGIVHDSSRQGEVSSIKEVANKIKHIFPRRATFTDNGKQYSGRQRLCQIILDEFRELEEVHPFTSNLRAHVLGMYGVPGSGKSTLCRFLCDHTVMSEDFGENVIYMDLPTNFEPQLRAEDYRELIRHYSKLIPRHKDLASLDLTQVREQLRHARITHKMFLVLDNITTSNLKSYETMVLDILSSSILAVGSKIMLVARTRAILEDLMFEVERYSTYKHAIKEVPYMTEQEAREIIRNRCHLYMKDNDIFNCRLTSYIPPSLHIPFVFEQIGVLLRNNYSENMEKLLKIVSKGKKDAARELLDMNFKQLSPELQVLFLDIALLIIPARCSQIDVVALILSRMNGTTDSDADTKKMEIKELRKHCALSIIEERIQIHDIFLEYAHNISANSESYVNATWSRILEAAQWSSPGFATVDLKCPEARTIDIGDGYRDVDVGDRDINLHLHLEIGAKAKAVIVRRDRDNCYEKCSLLLSGDLSSLVWLHVENVQQISISPTARGTNLCNLYRLELRKEGRKDLVMAAYSGEMREGISSLLDFVGRLIIEYWKAMSVSWPLTKSLPWVMYSLPRYTDDVMESFMTSGRTTKLRVLILINAGVRNLEDVCRFCPQLEELQVTDERQELMFVSIGSSTPKLTRLVIGRLDVSWRFDELIILRRKKNTYTPTCTRSSELILQLGECRELEEVVLDVSSFQRVEVKSALSSPRLRHLGLFNDMSVQVMGMALVSPSSLSLLRSVHIRCKKVETLDFTEHCLPLLETLRVHYSNSLTHVSICPFCLPNLLGLNVRGCKNLHQIEGLESLVKEQLRWMDLEFLPHLQCELRFGGVQLKVIGVTDCPGVKVSYDVLVSSGRIRLIDLDETCGVKVAANNVHCIEVELESEGISVQQMNEDNEDVDVVGFSQDEKTVASRTMQNESQGEMLRLQCADASRINLQNRLTFWQALNNLDELTIDGSFQHLQEIDGIQHLRVLRSLLVSNLRSLMRVSGAWPPSIGSIEFRNCPGLQGMSCLDNIPKLVRLWCIDCLKLKAVEGTFRQLLARECGRFCGFHFVGCESMETFPMEDAIEGLGQSLFVGWQPSLRVCGSKFATVGVMEEWLESAKWNSYLWAAALECLSWEYVIKGADDALDALTRYFLCRAYSRELLPQDPILYRGPSLPFDYVYRRKQELTNASQKRLSRLERVMDDLGFWVPLHHH